MEDAYSGLDILLTVRDMSDEEAGIDEVLFGCAMRKDDLEAFLADVRVLAEEKYGAASFAVLAQCREGDSAIDAAHRRWLVDMTRFDGTAESVCPS